MRSFGSLTTRRDTHVAPLFLALVAGAMFLSWSFYLTVTSAASHQSLPRAESLFATLYTHQDHSLQSSDAASSLPPGIAADACGTPFIANIERFLDTCPSSDPATAQIRSDFLIRRNGILVGEILCNEPISQLPVAQYTDELIVLQGLRVIYYMDRGRRGHLPWTPGSMYDWMKTRIGGIDIRDGSGSFCCESIDGKLYIAVGAQNDFNRDFDRKWEGISGNIGLYAHETRHVDGFFHTSCCGIAGGCDQTYDINNLSSYAVQWWLEKSWLMGDINVGFSCSSSSRILEIANWHLGGANSFRSRFCDDKPPVLSSPPNPGGLCPSAAPDFSFSLSPGMRTIPIGDSARFTVEVPGAASVVHLCAIIMPPTEKIAVTITPDVVSAGSATLTASTMPDTPLGTYTITVGGTSGIHTHTQTGTVVVTVAGPFITRAEVIGKKLYVYGANFDDGAKIYLNDDKQKTANDDVNPTTLLIGKKAGKKIERGETVMLKVKNSDGTLSNEFIYTRPDQ